MAPSESVSYSELLTGLKAAAEAMKREIMLGRDTQRLMFALGDAQRLVRRAEAVLDTPAPQIGQSEARELLHCLEQFIADHEASGNYCEGLDAAWIRSRNIAWHVKGLRPVQDSEPKGGR